MSAVASRHEFRKRARSAAVPVLFLAFAAYLAYHSVQGERGLIAWVRLTKSLDQVKVDLERATAERTQLERRVTLLRPDSLDPDLLDERARAVLNFGLPNDRVFLIPDPVDER